MRPDDHVRLLHRIEAIHTALDFVSGRQPADLNTDRMLLFALVRAIEVIGEAASKVSEDLRKQAAEIPWTLIVSMHNRRDSRRCVTG
ncbi:MAG: HepT-like ribonuclease domain-containing protein [Syntrophobacteraceae bacterium]